MSASPPILLLSNGDDPGLVGSYGRGFRQLGYSVEFWDAEAALDGHARLRSLGQRLRRLVAVEPWLKRANRDFVITVRERRPSLVVAACNSPVSAGALAQIRASLPSTKLVLLWPDPLQNIEVGTVQALPLYDIVGTYAQSSVGPLLRLGARRVEWLPFAADTELFDSPVDDGDDAAAFGCDVGFIANFRPEREDVVLGLLRAGVRVRVWGSSDWQARAKDRQSVRRYWERRLLEGKEFARATRQFKLALNVIDPTNFPGANMRFFETLACRGALLSSACPEMAHAFPDEVAAFYYDSPDHLIARVRGLLARDEGLRAVAHEGWRRVRAGHTYLDRCRQLLEMLEIQATS